MHIWEEEERRGRFLHPAGLLAQVATEEQSSLGSHGSPNTRSTRPSAPWTCWC